MILDDIVEKKKVRLEVAKEEKPFETVRREAEEAIRQGEGGEEFPFYKALKKPGLSLIGEYKKASPSLGNIPQNMKVEERIADYNRSVDAISCLTEEDYFHGSVPIFQEVRALTPLPMLRKDFMIDEYQFYEAKSIGANAILLIAAILDPVQMKDFYQLATELGLDALAEAHSEGQVEQALNAGCRIIGVNNRDLRDFTIRLDTTKRLRPLVPKAKCFVTESGIVKEEDVAYLKKCGIDACLVGRALMETKDPAALAEKWKAM